MSFGKPVNNKIGFLVHVCSGLCLLLFFVVTLSVILRFLGVGTVKLNDIQHYAFGTLVLLSVAVTFQANRHLKIEVLQIYNSLFSRFWLVVFVCIPMCLIAAVSLPEVLLSWGNLEGSAEPEGLGGVFLLKSMLPIAAALIALIAILKVRTNTCQGR